MTAGGAGRDNAASLSANSSGTDPYWPRGVTPRAQSASARDRVASTHYQSLHQHTQPQTSAHAVQTTANAREGAYYSSTPRTDVSSSSSYAYSTSAPPALNAPVAAIVPTPSSFWPAPDISTVGPSSTYSQHSSMTPHYRSIEASSRAPLQYQQYHPYPQSYYAHPTPHTEMLMDSTTEMGQHARSGRLPGTSPSSGTLPYYSPVTGSASSVMPIASEGQKASSVPAHHMPTVSEPYTPHSAYGQQSFQSSLSASLPYPTYPSLEGYSSTMPSHYAAHGPSTTTIGGMSLPSRPYEDSRLSYLVPIEVKHRRRTTKAQFKVLEGTFREITKPNAALRKSLSIQLDMPPRAIQIWFQNRRAKAKSSTKGGDTSIDTGSENADRGDRDAGPSKGKGQYTSSYETGLQRSNTGASSYSEPSSFGSRHGHLDERLSETSSSDQSHHSMGFANVLDRHAGLHGKTSYSSYDSGSSGMGGGDKIGHRMTPTGSLSSSNSMSMYTMPSSASSSASRDRAGSQSSSNYGHGNYNHTHPLSSLAAGESASSSSSSEYRRKQSISHQASSATLSASNAYGANPNSAGPGFALPGVAVGKRLSWSPQPSSANLPKTNVLPQDASMTPWS